MIPFLLFASMFVIGCLHIHHKAKAGAVAIFTLWMLIFVGDGKASRTFANSGDTLLGGTTAFPTTGTISFAVYPTFSQNDSLYHILFEINDGANFFQVLKGNTNTLYASWSGASSATAAASSYTLNSSAWNTITVTWASGGTMALYLNGTSVATVGSTVTYSTTATWSVGNRATGLYPWVGNVAYGGLWNRVLTSGEIATVAGPNPASSVSSGLINEWDLAGSSLTDSVGSMNLTASGPTVGSDPPAATGYAITGPASIGLGAYGTYSIALNGTCSTTCTVTPNDGGNGGVFAPTSLTWTLSGLPKTFIYSNGTAGSYTLTGTSSPSLTNGTLAITVITTGPHLTSGPFVAPTRSSASITWATDEASYVQARWCASGTSGCPGSYPNYGNLQWTGDGLPSHTQSAPITGTPANTLIYYIACSTGGTSSVTNCFPSSYTSLAAGPVIPAIPTLPTAVDAAVEPTGTVFSVGATSHDCNCSAANGCSADDGLVSSWNKAVADHNANGDIVEIDPTVTPYCASFDPYIFTPKWSGAPYIMIRAKNADTIWPGNRRVNPGCTGTSLASNPDCLNPFLANGPSDVALMPRIIDTITDISSTNCSTGLPAMSNQNPTLEVAAFPGSYRWWQGQSGNPWSMYYSSNVQPKSITAIPSSGTLTITVPGHGYTTGNYAHIAGATGPGASYVNSDWSLVVVDANTLTLEPITSMDLAFGNQAQGAASGGTIWVNKYQAVTYTSLPSNAPPGSCTLGMWYHIDGTFSPNPDELHRTYYGSQNPTTGACEIVPAYLNVTACTYTSPPVFEFSGTTDHVMIKGLSFEPMYLSSLPDIASCIGGTPCVPGTLQFIPSQAQLGRTGTRISQFISVDGLLDNHMYIDDVMMGCTDPTFTGAHPTAVRCPGPFIGNMGSEWHIGNSYLYGNQAYAGVFQETEGYGSDIYINMGGAGEIVNNFISGSGISVYFPEDLPSLASQVDTNVSGNLFNRPDKYWITTGSNNFLTSQGMMFYNRHSIEWKHGNRMLLNGNRFYGGWRDINDGAHVCMCTRNEVQFVSVSGSNFSTTTNDLAPGDQIGFTYTSTCPSLANTIWTIATVNLAAQSATFTANTGCTAANIFGARINALSASLTDATITNNSFYNGPEGIDVLANNTYGSFDGTGGGGQIIGPLAQRFKIANNLFYGTAGCRSGQGGSFVPGNGPGGSEIQLNQGIEDLIIDHNTSINREMVCATSQLLGIQFQGGAIGGQSTGPGGQQGSGLTVTNNIGEWYNSADFVADGDAAIHGKLALDNLFANPGSPGYTWAQNVIMKYQWNVGYPCESYSPGGGPPWGPYPAGTIGFNGGWNTVGPAETSPCLLGSVFPFYDYTNNNFRLKPSSTFNSGAASHASDGRGIGVDSDALDVAQGTVSNLRAHDIGSTTATIGFLAPNSTGCQVDWSSNGFTTFTPVTNAGGSRVQNVALTGLPSHTLISIRAECAAMQPVTSFMTH